MVSLRLCLQDSVILFHRDMYFSPNEMKEIKKKLYNCSKKHNSVENSLFGCDKGMLWLNYK